MINYFRLFAFLITLCFVAPFQASAAQENLITGDDWLLIQIAGLAPQDGTKVTALLQQLQQNFLYLDVDGGGVSARDYELAEQIARAQRRTETIKRWAQWDLDNDGKVTRAELELYWGRQARQLIRSESNVLLMPTPEQSVQRLAKLTDEALALDLDGDGIITFAEVRKTADDSAHKSLSVESPLKSKKLPESLDSKKDGAISLKEFETVARKVLGIIDSNGDGIISADERKTLNERAQDLLKAEKDQEAKAKAIEQIKACGIPMPKENTQVVLVGAYVGAGLSTVSIGDDEDATSVIDISVESGSKPLYIVLTSYEANIWRFSGAVDRIERVVACAFKTGTGGAPRVGIMGVANDKVAIAAGRDCIPDFSSPKETRTKEALKAAIGRYPDIVTATYSPRIFSVPSGTVETSEAGSHVMADQMVLPSSGPAISLWRRAQMYNRAGIILIDPALVVANRPVQRCAVLPREAGIAQLIEQGALEIFRSREEIVVSKEGGQKVLVPSHVVIRKKMRFPAGLAGAHGTITFVLPPGVPDPEGSPSHSRVIKGREAEEMLRGNNVK